ncbi:hypothetical protein F6X54_20190 [Micromonospora aurantiaca]|uniref:DUF2970 domain-containing protein n=1 Tax=Micromonospora aurantiaca (nom. illeg.) TaxID=47850 RepID=A0ABQ6UDA9_9ACTN|nr:hypothetical protein [Micromonospora aurantiaca]KAB1109119.1 hypothetical protein F6X54_20190 [Micromonospora aurantiaca]
MIHQLAAYATVFANELRDRSRRRNTDGGYSTESIAVTAFLVALALAAMAILGPKVLAKVRGITL